MEVNTQVARAKLTVAEDRQRGTGSYMNTLNKWSEKHYMPPSFNEAFALNEMAAFQRVFGDKGSVTAGSIASLTRRITETLAVLNNKIDAAKEVMAASVLSTGVVTLVNHDSIDYARKAASLKDNSASPWSTTTTDIEAQIVAGCDFIRNVGRHAGNAFDMIMSNAAWLNLKRSDYFKNTANFNQVKLLDVKMPIANAAGMSLLGTVSAGAYVVNCWGYDAVYENETQAGIRFWDEKEVCLVPVEGFAGEMAHAGIAVLRKDAPIGVVKAEKYIDDYVDDRLVNHMWRLRSAPLPIPVAVDRIYTMTVEA